MWLGYILHARIKSTEMAIVLFRAMVQERGGAYTDTVSVTKIIIILLEGVNPEHSHLQNIIY